MPGLQQLLAHTLILTLTVGGVACLCPAEAAGVSPAPAIHADHGHADGAHGEGVPGDADTAGCGHESCGSDCTRISAMSAKAKATIPGKATPSLDDLDMLPVAPGSPPSASASIHRSLCPSRQPLLRQDSPVRRFDRLLD